MADLDKIGGLPVSRDLDFCLAVRYMYSKIYLKESSYRMYLIESQALRSIKSPTTSCICCYYGLCQSQCCSAYNTDSIQDVSGVKF